MKSGQASQILTIFTLCGGTRRGLEGLLGALRSCWLGKRHAAPNRALLIAAAQGSMGTVWLSIHPWQLHGCQPSNSSPWCPF